MCLKAAITVRTKTLMFKQRSFRSYWVADTIGFNIETTVSKSLNLLACLQILNCLTFYVFINVLLNDQEYVIS